MIHKRIDLIRRSKYPSPYEFFSSKTSWDLGLDLVSYPKYLFKVLLVKIKNPKSRIDFNLTKLCLGLSIKLAIKIAFIILVTHLYKYFE